MPQVDAIADGAERPERRQGEEARDDSHGKTDAAHDERCAGELRDPEAPPIEELALTVEEAPRGAEDRERYEPDRVPRARRTVSRAREARGRERRTDGDRRAARV